MTRAPVPSIGDYTQLGTQLWRLERDVVIPSRGYRLCLTAGQVSDGASVPRPFWSICSPTELSLDAAFVHDALYASGGIIDVRTWTGEAQRARFTRRACDTFLYDIAARAGCPWWKRGLAWDMVRLFGWRRQHWNRATGNGAISAGVAT